MVLGRIIKQVSAECLNARITTLIFFIFLLCPLIHEFISFLACNLVIILNNLKIFGKIIEWVTTAAACWNDNSAYL